MKSFKRYFGDRKFYAMVLAIAIPVIIQNGVTNFVSLLDNIMVGRTGTEQMSGVAIVNELIFVYNLCLFGACSGVSIFSSQFYGQRDWKGMRDSFRLKLILCVAISILAILILVFAGDTLINYYLLSGDGEGDALATLEYGREYLAVMLIGLVPFALSQTYSGTMREMGDTVTPMVAGIAAVFTNLIFNWLLIFGKLGFPELGVKGAAIATVISRFVELGIVAVKTHLNAENYKYIQGVYRSLKVPATLVKKVAIKGSPLILNETLWAAGMAVLHQSYSLRGLEVIAGMNISSTIINLFNVVFIALGSAIGIVVGPLLGANEMEEAKDTATKMITFSVLVCFIMGFLLFLVAPLFPKIYNTSESARDIATSVIRIGAIFMPVYSFEHASYFTIRSGGKTGITFLFDSGYTWILAVPVAYVLSRFTGMAIIPMYLCIQLLDFIKCGVGFVLVRKGIWINNIVESEE